MYAAKLFCEGRDKIFPNPDKPYVLALGWQKDNFFPPSLPLIILVDPAIQVSTGILVHPILVETEERIGGGHEAEPGEVGHAC